MKFRFKRMWEETEDPSKTASKRIRLWDLIKAKPDGPAYYQNLVRRQRGRCLCYQLGWGTAGR